MMYGITIHTHPHVQVTSILSLVAEHNVSISVVEHPILRWLKKHSFHLLHPPDPHPRLSHRKGKLAGCRTQIEHLAEGNRKSGDSVYVEIRGRMGLCYEEGNR